MGSQVRDGFLGTHSWSSLRGSRVHNITSRMAQHSRARLRTPATLSPQIMEALLLPLFPVLGSYGRYLLDKGLSSSKSVETFFSTRLVTMVLLCFRYLILCNRLFSELSCLKPPFYFTQGFVGWRFGKGSAEQFVSGPGSVSCSAWSYWSPAKVASSPIKLVLIGMSHPSLCLRLQGISMWLRFLTACFFLDGLISNMVAASQEARSSSWQVW